MLADLILAAAVIAVVAGAIAALAGRPLRTRAFGVATIATGLLAFEALYLGIVCGLAENQSVEFRERCGDGAATYPLIGVLLMYLVAASTGLESRYAWFPYGASALEVAIFLASAIWPWLVVTTA